MTTISTHELAQYAADSRHSIAGYKQRKLEAVRRAYDEMNRQIPVRLIQMLAILVAAQELTVAFT